MEGRYLRVKNWAELQHYDPRQRRPPWIKAYNTLLDSGTAFMALSETEQWQLFRIWLVASRSAVVTLDEKGREVPVLADDEKSLRRSTMSLSRLPLAKFIRDGWLVPVAPDEVLAASKPASAAAIAVLALSKEEEKPKRKREEENPSDLVLAPLSETQSPTSYEGGRDFTTLGKLKHACRAHVDSSGKIDRAARGCSEADVIGALEACRGPGVRDRLAVALSELKKRKAA